MISPVDSGDIYGFEYDREEHETFDSEDKEKEPKIIIGTYTVGNPRTVMVIDTYTTTAYLAMFGSIWFDYHTLEADFGGRVSFEHGEAVLITLAINVSRFSSVNYQEEDCCDKANDKVGKG